MTPVKNRPDHVVILGAGPAGLAVAHELSASGVKATVLERNDFVGGLCNTEEVNGYKFDLGGHRWFTKNEDLNNWFRRLMGDEIVMVNRISRIFHHGIFYNYPIEFGNVLVKSSPLTVLHAGFSFLGESIRQAIAPKPIKNMEDAYTAQFGKKLYQMFFEQYSEKVWGHPCNELSASWVSQRTKGLSIWGVVANALFKSKKDKVVSLIELFMYPRDGYVRIPQRMAEDIEKAGNKVQLESTVTAVKANGPGDFEVTYKDKAGKETVVKANAVVSTIPLGIFARILTPKCSPEVEAAAKTMEFRDIITVNLMLKRKQVTPDTWIYVQDREIVFGRIHEPKNWSPAMVPDDDHTSVVLEVFCTRGDHLWNMTDDELAKQCVEDMVTKLKFIDRSEVVGWHVVRAIQAYPVYDLTYEDKLKVVMDYINAIPGAHVVGRGGTHRYNNADHSIEMGLLLGRHLLGNNVDYMAVNTEQEYHEEIRSSMGRDHYVPTAEPEMEVVRSKGAA
ncbi:NAD(P)/FAD-dependent oxidoreductase [soil metagenome]